MLNREGVFYDGWGVGALAEGVEIGDLAQAALVNYNIVRLRASLGSQNRPNPRMLVEANLSVGACSWRITMPG